MPHPKVDFSKSPFIVIWETTQACDLVCLHCRAKAQPDALPGELSHEQGISLIDDVARMGTSIMVLSGGDPLKRKDLTGLIRHGKSRGLRMGTIPAATELLTRQVVRGLKDSGLDQMALSLDASTLELHDRFRGVEGAFEKTMQAIKWAHEAKLPLQINTVMSLHNFGDVDRIIDLVQKLGIVFWEVFFLVPVGRGESIGGLSASQYEEVFAKLYPVAKKRSFIVKVTEAPHFRRYYVQQQLKEAGIDTNKLSWSSKELPEELRSILGPQGSIGRAPEGVNAGRGHCFVAHDGEVFPSGFLPLSVGNVKTNGIEELYQTAHTLKALRDPDKLKGRCGICEYRWICGGSRSRAFGLTGDYLAEDPSCAYVPASQQAQRA